VRSALGLGGLRLLSASVAWAECTLPSLALISAAFRAHRFQLACVCCMCGLHVGIALCMNNARLLSFSACVAWCAFLPPFGFGVQTNAPTGSPQQVGMARQSSTLPAMAPLLTFVVATGLYHMPSRVATCSADGSGERLWSALLNNRWNAFTSVEDHVTWYIAPAKLADGSLVDIWAHGAPVSWEVPASAARSGRWKSFAAVGASGEAPEALWNYLCTEWNRGYPDERRVLRYKFFLLSANISTGPASADSDGHGPPSKRLLQSFDCDTCGGSR